MTSDSRAGAEIRYASLLWAATRKVIAARHMLSLAERELEDLGRNREARIEALRLWSEIEEDMMNARESS